MELKCSPRRMRLDYQKLNNKLPRQSDKTQGARQRSGAEKRNSRIIVSPGEKGHFSRHGRAATRANRTRARRANEKKKQCGGE